MTKSQETRGRLLEAAGQTFAEHGFRAATVREICRRARANVAAVNYHFRGKKGLYEAVLRHWAGIALQKYPLTLGLRDGAPAEERLRTFIRAFLFRLTDKGRPAWHGRLLAREMVEPTGALDRLVRELMRPMYERLAGILRELLGRRASGETIRLCAFSILGQGTFYRHCKAVIHRLHPRQRFDTKDIERLAEHIAEFSVQAIQQLAKRKESRG